MRVWSDTWTWIGQNGAQLQVIASVMVVIATLLAVLVALRPSMIRPIAYFSTEQLNDGKGVRWEYLVLRAVNRSSRPLLIRELSGLETERRAELREATAVSLKPGEESVIMKWMVRSYADSDIIGKPGRIRVYGLLFPVYPKTETVRIVNSHFRGDQQVRTG